ncbi:MAG: VOC family protein [Phycisphaerales bacterium]|nr:VOC family protein [Phycisphaerales bacterium]MCI0677161.1 VOC family protein [Phycisphaerales bacterium]
MRTPFGALEFLYMGTADFERDFNHYKDTLGAELVWAFHKFGAKVAAFRIGAGPLLLIADHRPAPSCLLVYSVEHLEKTADLLRSRGWKPDGDAFEIPNGLAYRFTDPSGNQIAIFQNDRPRQMQDAYANPNNPHAIRTSQH